MKKRKQKTKQVRISEKAHFRLTVRAAKERKTLIRLLDELAGV